MLTILSVYLIVFYRVNDHVIKTVETVAYYVSGYIHSRKRGKVLYIFADIGVLLTKTFEEMRGDQQLSIRPFFSKRN